MNEVVQALLLDATLRRMEIAKHWRKQIADLEAQLAEARQRERECLYEMEQIDATLAQDVAAA